MFYHKIGLHQNLKKTEQKSKLITVLSHGIKQIQHKYTLLSNYYFSTFSFIKTKQSLKTD